MCGAVSVALLWAFYVLLVIQAAISIELIDKIASEGTLHPYSSVFTFVVMVIGLVYILFAFVVWTANILILVRTIIHGQEKSRCHQRR